MASGWAIRKYYTVVPFVLSLSLSVEVSAAPVALLCSGTLQVVRTGWGYTKEAIQRGLTSTNETISIEVDIAAKTLSIDADVWPITGDTSGTEIVSVGTQGDARLSLSLNRITGAVAFIFTSTGVLAMHQDFSGVCKPGKRLF